jgi:hypothetical protein
MKAAKLSGGRGWVINLTTAKALSLTVFPQSPEECTGRPTDDCVRLLAGSRAARDDRDGSEIASDAWVGRPLGVTS